MKKLLFLVLALAFSVAARAQILNAPSSVNSGEEYGVFVGGYGTSHTHGELYRNGSFVESGDEYEWYSLSMAYWATDYGNQTVHYDAFVSYEDGYWGSEWASANVVVSVPNTAPTITWTQNPANAAVNEWFNIQARGNDSDGNLVAVRVWREWVPHAFNGGGNGYENYSDPNGSYLDHSGTVTFMAEAEDSNGATSGVIYHTVTISNDAPNVSSSAGNIYVGQAATVSWSASDPNSNLSYVAVWVTQWGSPYWDYLGSGGASGAISWSGSAHFNSSNPASGSYLFVVRAVDAENAYTDSYATFDVINRAPDSATVSSGGVTQINLGQSVTISGTLHDPDGNLALHNLYYIAPSGGGWTAILSGTPSNGTNSSLSTSFTPNQLGTWVLGNNGHDNYEWGQWATLSITVVDGTAPSVPGGLGSSSITPTSFTLSWSASTDNVGVTLYEVRRDSTSLGTTASTSMAVSSLTQGTGYSMTVRAKDAAGNWSAWSSALVVNTTDTQAPTVPGGLASASITATNFTLNWNASSDNIGVTAYEVMRGATSLGTTGSTSMSITSLTQGTAYSMTVRARDAAGNWSAWSGALVVTTTDTQAPTVPGGLAATSLTPNSFTLSWTASTDNIGVTTYEVKKGSTSLGTTGGTSMSVGSLIPSTAYAMTVRARDAAGNWSAWNGALNVTTSPPNSTTDTDGDGVPDVIELQLGTDPNSAKQTDSANQSALKIHRPTP